MVMKEDQENMKVYFILGKKNILKSGTTETQALIYGLAFIDEE